MSTSSPDTAVAARRHGVAPLLQVTAVYAAGRVVTFALLYLAAAVAPDGSRFGPGAGSIERFILGWDAQWYWSIAFSGYPTSLTVEPSGHVAENAWAFMPLYAWVSQIVSLPFGHWGAGAAVVSLVSGLVASIALYRMLRRRIGHVAALWAVVFFANGPLAALFHVGYAESMFLALLLLALDCVVERRFGWLFVIIPVMAFTRPGILPFALMLGLYGIWRWFRRGVDPLPATQIVQIIAAGLLGAVSGFAWQVIAGIVTGMPGAYLATELAWRQNWVTDAPTTFFPFEPWIAGGEFWFGIWGVPSWLGWALFLAALGGVIWALVRSASVRALGMEIRLWSASYLLYLLAVFFPQSSTLRLLLPLTPLWGAVAVRTTTFERWAVLGLCLVGQWIWIFSVYANGSQFWQIP